jgi:hypothetical protein
MEGGRRMALWRCSFGKITKQVISYVLKGTNYSCGCLKRERNLRHGMRKSKFYMVWAWMKGRCLNKRKKEFIHYGGRGIKICDRWLKFENFRDDMLHWYTAHVVGFGEKNTTLERINVNGNYEPDNCRWATWSEQNLNKRTKV